MKLIILLVVLAAVIYAKAATPPPTMLFGPAPPDDSSSSDYDTEESDEQPDQQADQQPEQQPQGHEHHRRRKCKPDGTQETGPDGEIRPCKPRSHDRRKLKEGQENESAASPVLGTYEMPNPYTREVKPEPY